MRELAAPLAASLGLTPPGPVDLSAALADQVAESGEAIADAVGTTLRNIVAVIAGLFTAVVISVGMAAGEVTLLGWLRRFLPERSYADIAALERAIALSFGVHPRPGPHRIDLRQPDRHRRPPPRCLAPLIAVIAGLIQFIPFIGPLLGWAVLPAFALVLAPDVVVPALVLSLLSAAVMQLVVTRMVMGRAVSIRAAAVLSVVMLGTAIAGVTGRSSPSRPRPRSWPSPTI